MMAAAMATTHTSSDSTSRMKPRHRPITTETSRMATITQSAPLRLDMLPLSAAVRDDQAVESLLALELLLLRLRLRAAHVRADTHRPALPAPLDDGRIAGLAQAVAQLVRIGLVAEGADLHRPGARGGTGRGVGRRRPLAFLHRGPGIGHGRDEELPRLFGLGPRGPGTGTQPDQ